ncbi:MAG TPA: tetratricopeptide repeat protein, partial [Phenylobacterium sp.]
MNVDKYDLPLSTTSGRAAALYREGVDLMLSAWPGAAERLSAAIDADPEFALAHAARARLYAGHGRSAEARKEIKAARGLAARRGDEREQSHVDVLALAIGGRSPEALDRALEHAGLWPQDVLILSLPLGAFGLFAFSGMADHDQARVDLCERHADRFASDDWWFLASRGWALAENGEVARGRAMLERSFELRRENANGVHALVHAMFEGGAGADSDALIEGWLPSYDRSGLLHGHIAWHAAITALDRGDVANALAIYEDKVRPSVSLGLPINVVSDGASLLWRLDAYGHGAPADLWRELADYARAAYPEAGHPFVDAHMSLVEAATGDRDALDRRIAALDAMVDGNALAAGPVAPAICRAALAFATEDFAECVRLLG